MNEDIFIMEVRKFLKKVGVTSQREIEQAVRDGLENGRITSADKVKVKAVITIEGLSDGHEVTGEIALS
jgi:hypothetical protein